MGNYLEDRRKELGLTQQEVAQVVGVTAATISRYESGEIGNMRRDRIQAYAKALHTSTNFIMTGELAPTVPAGCEPLPETEPVPLLGEIACGEPILAVEDYEETVSAPVDLRCDFALRCRGKSMIEAGIDDGDIVYIRSQATVDNGQIAAVCIDDEATLKRVHWNGRALILSPANASMEPLVYTGPELDEVRILGLAVGFTHWL